MTTNNPYPLMALVLLLLSCAEPKVEIPPLIQPPIANWDPKYTVFELDAEQGDTFVFETGSIIKIPALALVDSAGNTVKGKVEIRYREMHDATDIFLAGVPMSYDTAGVTEALKTAGMFELRAYQAGKPLAIDSAKQVDIKLASFTMGNQYNSYYLDEKARNWRYTGHDTMEVNPKKRLLIEKIKTMIPKRPFPLDQGYFSFNYNAILDVYYNNKVKDFGDRKPGHKAEKYGLAWWNTYNGWGIKFKGSQELSSMMVWKKRSAGKMPQWMKQEAYVRSMTPAGRNLYLVECINSKTEQSFTFKAEAIMRISELFAYPPEKWQKDYDGVMAEIESERRRLAQMAGIYRNLSIKATGYHNFDFVMKLPGTLPLAGNFTAPNWKPTNTNLDPLDQVIYVAANNKGFVQFSKHKWNSIYIAPDTSARFITVLKDSTIGLFTNVRHRQINFDSLRTTEKPNYEFSLEAVPLDSVEQLRQLMQM